MRRILLLCLFTVMSLAVAGQTAIETASASAAFDGSWTVIIMTERGDCNNVPGLNVDIRDGTLAYSGSFSLELHGRVSNDGAVQVRVAAAGQSANATGRLSTRFGGGTWHGAGTGGACAGRWSAERA